MPLFRKKNDVARLLKSIARDRVKAAKKAWKEGKITYSQFRAIKQEAKELKTFARRISPGLLGGFGRRMYAFDVSKEHLKDVFGENILDYLPERLTLYYGPLARITGLEARVLGAKEGVRPVLGTVKLGKYLSARMAMALGVPGPGSRSLGVSRITKRLFARRLGGNIPKITGAEAGAEAKEVRINIPGGEVDMARLARFRKLLSRRKKKKIEEAEGKKSRKSVSKPVMAFEEKLKEPKKKAQYILNLQKKLGRYVSNTERYRVIKQILEKHHTEWKPQEVNRIKSELKKLQRKHHLEGVAEKFKEITQKILEDPHILNRDKRLKRTYKNLLSRIDTAIENTDLIAKVYGIKWNPEEDRSARKYWEEIEKKKTKLRDTLNTLKTIVEYPLTVQPGERRKISSLIKIIDKLEQHEKEVDPAWRAHQILLSKPAKDLTEEERKLIEDLITNSLEKKRLDEDLVPEAKKLLNTHPKYWTERDVAFVENLLSELEKEERAITGLAGFGDRGVVKPETTVDYLDITDPDKVMNVVKDHIRDILKTKLSAEVLNQVISEGKSYNIYKTPESWIANVYGKHINDVAYAITKELTGMRWDEKKGKWVKSYGVADSVPKVKVENIRRMIAEGLKLVPPSKEAKEGKVVFELPGEKKRKLIETYFKEEFQKFGVKKKRERD